MHVYVCVHACACVSSAVPTGVGCVHFDTIPRSMYQMYVNEVHGAHIGSVCTSERGYVRR